MQFSFRSAIQLIAINIALIGYVHAAQVASGSYNQGFGTWHPALVKKSSQLTWSFNRDIQDIPDYEKYGVYFVNDVVCKQDFCIAAADSNTDKLYSQPFFLVTNQSNSTWFAKTILNSPVALRSYLRSVDCSDLMCVGVGETDHRGGESKALMTISSDHGNSWTFLENIKDWPTMQEGFLKQVSCNQQTCIAIGGYSQKRFNENTPLIVVSQDAGKSWFTSREIDNAKIFPKYTTLNTIKCHNKHCVIGGSYRDFFEKATPLFLYSDDNGKSWNSVKFKSSIKGFINKLDITDSGTVIAIGTTGIYRSDDNGHTWIQQSVPGYPQELFEKLGTLNLSCSKHNCIAGSESYLEAHFPILVTQDDGHSWSVSNIAPLVEDGSGHINNLNCSGMQCTIIGTAIDITKPFILESEDAGTTWKAAVIKDIPFQLLDLRLTGLS